MYEFLDDKKIFITGKNSQLAFYFLQTMADTKAVVAAYSREECDIANRKQVFTLIEKEKPDYVINFAADNLIDDAERDSTRADAVNTLGVSALADACRKNSVFFIHFSSSHVFDGQKNSPYTEEDKTCPINAYGLSKVRGEQAIIENMQDYLLFRLSWAFGYGKNCFLSKVAEWSKKNPIIKISADEISSPIFSQDVIDVMLMSMEKGLKGLYHLSSRGQCSRFEYVSYFIKKMELTNTVEPVAAEHFHLEAKRPAYTCLSANKIEKDLGVTMEDWKEGLDKYVMMRRKGAL